MASAWSGVNSIVQNESPFTYYFHCAVHCLNLSASVAVKVSAMQNAENVARKKETKCYLVGLSETRFVERHASTGLPVKHSKLGAKKNFNKVCPKTVQNALKWPLQ